jgi:hypothetical protein
VGLFCFLHNIHAQNPSKTKNNKKNLNDFSFTLHEETLNKVFETIGEISGTNYYSVLLISGKYHWTIINPKINLKPDSSDFTCDAKVRVGPFNYKTPVKGRVKIWLDNDKNKINVKITTAIFELYTMVFGKKIHIKNIELANYFKDPFLFEGPKSMGTDFEFITPDSVKKKVFIRPCDCELETSYKKMTAKCEVQVSDKPIPINGTLENPQNSEGIILDKSKR